MTGRTRAALTDRLATMEGHLKGIRKMIEADASCLDVLRQTHAVERALKAFGCALLDARLHECIPAGLGNGRQDETIRELSELFALSRK
jgi:CsoR family transcriptional regulator, copper-sensing transcriptional repressor